MLVLQLVDHVAEDEQRSQITKECTVGLSTQCHQLADLSKLRKMDGELIYCLLSIKDMIDCLFSKIRIWFRAGLRSIVIKSVILIDTQLTYNTHAQFRIYSRRGGP